MKELVHGLYRTVRNPRQGFQLAVVRQFIKFSIVGVVNTINSSVVYWIATRPFHIKPLIANAISFTIATSLSYLLNKTWTFRDAAARSTRQYSLFYLINLVGFVISETMLYILHIRLGVHDFIAFMSGVVIAMFWNFNANRAWTFRRF